MQSINTVERAKADAHEKHLQVFFSAPDTWYFSRLQEIRMQALVSLSLSTICFQKFANSLDPEYLRRLAKPNRGKQANQELIM